MDGMTAQALLGTKWVTKAIARTALLGPSGTLAQEQRGHTPVGETGRQLSELPRLVVQGDAPVTAPEFEVGGLLGEGGMGVIHVARQRALERDVALKRVSASRADDDDAIMALLSEARIMGALEHPNIVPVHALGRSDERTPVLVMKRVAGVSWEQLLSNPSHPGWPEGAKDRLTWNLQTLMQVCNAVHFAHSRQVIHLDVKPANVMIGEYGEVYLMDWGAALQRIPTAEIEPFIVGTPAYMAPEMLQGIGPNLDARTDVYLLGSTLHRVLMSTPRHVGDQAADVFLHVAKSEPVDYPDSVPPELAALCNRATSADMSARPPTALALRQHIADFLQHRGATALADTASARLAELRAVLGRRDATLSWGERESRQVRTLFDECRFGFRESLRAWPDHAPAKRGLEEALACMIDHEISLGHLDAATSLYADLVDEDPRLAGRLETLRRERKSRAEELSRLRQIADDHDLGVAPRARMVAQVFLGALLGFGPLVASLVSPEPPTHTQTFSGLVLIGLLVGALGLSDRRRVLANRINRQVWTGGLLLIGALGAAQVLGALLHQSVLATMILGLVVVATMLGMLAIFVARGLALTVVITLGAAVGAALSPRHGLTVIGIAGLLDTLVCALLLRSLR